MKDTKNKFHKFSSLSEFHHKFGLTKPEHPLISFISLEEMSMPEDILPDFMVMEFYKIAYKDTIGSAKYGQSHYDFGEGGMVFTAPGQLFEKPKNNKSKGYILLIHPDFLLSYPLAKKVKLYNYFTYATDEALHLSEKEKVTIFSVFNIIKEELDSRIDNFSHDVLISQIDLLLTYCERFYKRQFITEKALNNGLIQQFEDILNQYFNNEQAIQKGLPSVQYIAEQLNVSANYLSDMLRSLTGSNTQQHIHNKLIELAKEILSTTDLSVAEIAYQLGFEYPQSFSRLFKTKTSMTPAQFRQSFN
ncbi:helix-turn-helix domain-containing protein [Epilithonimonas lactis]|uniref:AraC family transcriptional regulator n=1 Tax=Epilithonimonas lactis TaxID=421072 RepID=A0A085B6E4_9FLAO|nr:helix-turn-helix domain-containing protein [Epilithonimonas lactis]KFC18039.1 AraC family transcriptional regulator [Epilithonimonas lactis]SEP88005.1 Helix-turn-helix domain-containing protein [Epilithonimonas lactis]